jgi:hypothetical protein
MPAALLPLPLQQPGPTMPRLRLDWLVTFFFLSSFTGENRARAA